MVSKPVTSRSIWRSALLISFALGCGSSTPRSVDSRPAGAPADLVLQNADVRGRTTQLAIRHGEIADDAVIGPNTRVIDLQGKTAVVGLADAHCHLYGLGADLENVNVRNLPSEQDVVLTVAAAAKTRPASEWLLGRGWDQNKWPGQAFPSKASLDAVVSDRPVLLRRVDGHAAWVNSRALVEAGITKATPDPVGGKIVRDAKGEPTGVLIDNAMDLVDAKRPPATPEVIERRILAAAKIATELGFTAVHEMGIDDATADVYRKLAREKRLPLRVYGFAGGTTRDATPQPAEGRFVMRGIKFFADGALGSRGARLYEPYDDENTHGLWVTEPAQLTKLVEQYAINGWDIAVHAIGDAGIGATLDAFAVARAKSGWARLRVEHVQVIADKDIPRMVELKAIASMQPTHATSDMAWAEARVGKQRIQGAYAWRTMLDKKIPLAFGSDFPVEEVNPLLGLQSAVTRGGWYPEQKLTLDEAVHAFTVGAAEAVGEKAGEAADVTVFDGALTEATLLERKVLMTIVGGEIVYEAPAP